jgi:hypothetical protein
MNSSTLPRGLLRGGPAIGESEHILLCEDQRMRPFGFLELFQKANTQKRQLLHSD